MQMQRSDKGDSQNPAVSIRVQEPENFKVLIHEIWRRFTEQHIEMRRRPSGFEVDASTTP